MAFFCSCRVFVPKIGKCLLGLYSKRNISGINCLLPAAILRGTGARRGALPKGASMRIPVAIAACMLFAAPSFCMAHPQRTQSAPPQQGQIAQPQQMLPPTNAQRLRVPGDVMANKLIYIEPPVYPQIAVVARVSGIVMLNAVVAEDGTVEELMSISGPALLRQAAIYAVREWRFEPTLLNGQPIEVETTVPIRFDLEDAREYKSKIDLREPGSPRAFLSESIGAVGAGKKQEWKAFISAFEDATSRAWLEAIPSSISDEKGQVTITFVLRRDGSVGPISVKKPSGDAAMDAASQLAITKSAPFHSLPSDLPYAAVVLRVTFACDHAHALSSAARATQ
jgi:TonB family protein